MLLKMQTVLVLIKITSIFDEELLSETTVECTASYFNKITWCSRWFCTPLTWGSVLLYLRSPKGGYCSVSDDLCWFFLHLEGIAYVKNYMYIYNKTDNSKNKNL